MCKVLEMHTYVLRQTIFETCKKLPYLVILIFGKNICFSLINLKVFQKKVDQIFHLIQIPDL